jgi:hypothetical protein
MTRWDDPDQVIEVLRLASNGTPHACSKLLAAVVRVARESGYARVKMVVGAHERSAPSFLSAAGFRFDGQTSGDAWDHPSRRDGRTRRDREPQGPKHRWIYDLRPIETVTVVRRSCDECGARIRLDARPEKRTCSDRCRQRASRRFRVGTRDAESAQA